MSERCFHPEWQASLQQDLEEGNVVKLDMRKAPWEIVGTPDFVGDALFSLDTTTPGTMHRLSDILYYRLA